MLRVPTIPDARRQPRFKIEVDIRINSRKCGALKGYTVDISESGIAAMLRIEASLGEVVDLDFELPCGAVTVQAIGRQRNAFRYGFEFVDSDSMNELIRRTCRDLAVDQSLTWPDLPRCESQAGGERVLQGLCPSDATQFQYRGARITLSLPGA